MVPSKNTKTIRIIVAHKRDLETTIHLINRELLKHIDAAYMKGMQSRVSGPIVSATKRVLIFKYKIEMYKDTIAPFLYTEVMSRN